MRQRRQTRPASPMAVPAAAGPAQVSAEPRTMPVRRPAQPAPTTGILRSEDVLQESRYVRADLVRMLLTVVAVVVFMVAAHFLLQ